MRSWFVGSASRLTRAAVLSAVTLAAVVPGLVAGGCTRPERAASGGTKASATITVFAAASLAEAFSEIGRAFEAAHPASRVTFNFAGSATLVAQIGRGAPADVFASADAASMARLAASDGTLGAPAVFAHNRLAVIVPAGNPRRVQAIEDLSDPSLLVVLAAGEVPLGAYSQQVLTKAGVKVTPRSWEADAKAVVAKVGAGEADAAIAYVTDARAAEGKIDEIRIPDEHNVNAEYPIAVTRTTTEPAAARAFVEFVVGPQAQAVLAAHGFSSP